MPDGAAGRKRPSTVQAAGRGRGYTRKGGRGQQPIHRATATWFESKRPVFRFVGLFTLLIVLFYACYVPMNQAGAFHSYLAFLARACGVVLNLVGQEVTVSGRTVFSSAFSFNVVAGCDGLEAVALFVSAVLASPVSWRARLIFVVAGTAVFMVVNILRIATLYCVGAYFPKALDFVHLDAWPAVLIVVVLVCWVIWAKKASRQSVLQLDQ